MNRSRTRLAIALGVLALGACATTTVNQASEEQAIRAVADEYRTAFNARDVDRLVALHTPDAVVMVSNSPLATGSTELRRAFTEVLTPGTTLSFAPTRINVVSPTVATEIGTYTLSFDTPQGRVTDRGNYTTVLHKVNGQWRIAVSAPVTTTPMPMPGAATTAAEMGDLQMLAGSGLSWSDFTPTGFDPGMKLAVMHGDPGKKGDYVVRLMFPAGYRFPVHWHPTAEHLTVVSGTFQLGMGNAADWNALKSYAPGDFLYIPARHAHFGGSTAQVTSVIQLHGEGPFQVMLGAPK
ncbi:MAG: SgcJ/EcaC family oxidoreductase [Gemmatimonadaceae bacterium]